MSTVRGRYQVPALVWLTRALLGLGLLGGFGPQDWRVPVATTVVVVVVAAPLIRVAWLILRWTQEHDRRFVVFGSALLGVVAIGAGLAAAGVGS